MSTWNESIALEMERITASKLEAQEERAAKILELSKELLSIAEQLNGLTYKAEHCWDDYDYKLQDVLTDRLKEIKEELLK